MDKAILVIDMPSSCEECPVRSFVGYGKWCAGHEDTSISSYPIKPDWCPMIEIPKHIIYFGEDDYAEGYNDCLDEILNT